MTQGSNDRSARAELRSAVDSLRLDLRTAENKLMAVDSLCRNSDGSWKNSYATVQVVSLIAALGAGSRSDNSGLVNSLLSLREALEQGSPVSPNDVFALDRATRLLADGR